MVRAPPAEQAQVRARLAAELRQRYEDVDPQGLYAFATVTMMTYARGSGRLDLHLFRGDTVMSFNPFTHDPEWRFPYGHGQEVHYNRNLEFINHQQARFVPVADERMPSDASRQPETTYSDIMATVAFRFVDTVPHHEERRKAVRVMVEAVSLDGRNHQSWFVRNRPLPNRPFRVAAAEVTAPVAGPIDFDDALGFFLYHHAAGTTPDFEALGQLTDAVWTAPQFEKPTVARREAERLRRSFESVDPEATYVIHTNTFLHYDLETERFKLSAFEPGTVIYIEPLFRLGVTGRRGTAGDRARHAYRHVMQFPNADRYQYLALPRDQAAAMPQVYREARTRANVRVELRVAGAGPGPRNAPGGALAMNVQSIHLTPHNEEAAVNWPFNSPIRR